MKKPGLSSLRKQGSILFVLLVAMAAVACIGEAGGTGEAVKDAADASAACPIDGFCDGSGQICSNDSSIKCICDARSVCTWSRPKTCTEQPTLSCEEKLVGNYTDVCSKTKFYACCKSGVEFKWTEGKLCPSPADGGVDADASASTDASPEVAFDAADGGVDGDSDVVVDSGPGDIGSVDSGKAEVAPDTGAPDSGTVVDTGIVDSGVDTAPADTGAPDTAPKTDTGTPPDTGTVADTSPSDAGGCSVPEPKGACTAMCVKIFRCDPPLSSVCCAGTWTMGTCSSCPADAGPTDTGTVAEVGSADTGVVDSTSGDTGAGDTVAVDTGFDTGGADTYVVGDTSGDALADADAGDSASDTDASDTAPTTDTGVSDATVGKWRIEYVHDTTVDTAGPFRVFVWSTTGVTTGGFGLTELICSKTGAALICDLPGVPGKELQAWAEVRLADSGVKGWTCYAVAPCEYKVRGTFTVLSPSGVRTVLTPAWNQDGYTPNRCWSCNAAMGSPVACVKEKTNCVP